MASTMRRNGLAFGRSGTINKGTVEFATLINFYFTPHIHILGQLLLYGALQATAMQSIVLVSQAFDNILINIFGKTCALAMSGEAKGWLCVVQEATASSPSPFGSVMILFSLGSLITLLLSIPLGIMNLDDNIMIQIVAFCLAMCIGLEWIGASIVNGLDTSRVPTFGEPSGFAQAIGPVLLNLGFTTVVPSWVNIKKKTVNAQAVVYSSTGIATAFYILMGIFTALGFSIDPISQNLMPALLSSNTVNKVFAYAFTLVMLLPAIPVCFIVTKINLVQNKVTGTKVATLLAQVLPWLMVIPLQTGSAMKPFMTWTSLIFVSTANFIIPLAIYLKCLKFRRAYNSDRVLTPKQRELLKAIHWSSSTIQDYISGKRAGAHGRRRRRRRETKRKREPVALLDNDIDESQPPSQHADAPAIVLSASEGIDGGGAVTGDLGEGNMRVDTDEGGRGRQGTGASWKSGDSAGRVRKTVKIDVPPEAEETSSEDEVHLHGDEAEEEELRSRPGLGEKRPSFFERMGTLGRRGTLNRLEGEEKAFRRDSLKSDTSASETSGSEGVGGGEGVETEEEEEPSYLKEDVPDPDAEMK
ncbi:hypothetical protein HK097_011525, partial [Rhizophlyctis rosea]